MKDLIDSILINENVNNRRICVNFEDDNLLLDPDYLFRVMELFSRKFPGCKFFMENGIDYALLSKSLVDRLHKGGFQKFNISLGAARADISAACDRVLDIARYESVLMQIASYKVPAITYFICGLQGDTPESVAGILAYLCGKPTMVGISPFYAIPGMPGFSKSRFNRLSPCLSAGSSAFQWHNDSISIKSTITAFRISRYINLTKAKKKQPIDIKVVTKIKSANALFSAFNENGGYRIEKIDGLDDKMIQAFFSIYTTASC